MDDLTETPEITDSEKLDFLYQVALKINALVESVNPEQIQHVAASPMMVMITKMLNKG